MPNATILTPEHRWACPNCEHTRVTSAGGTHTVIHTCAGLRGIVAPLVKAGTRCRVEARVREDYVRNETPQRDINGQPIMAVVTTREDGQDCMVLAPLVTAGGGS